jgi:hypothetical protein
MGGRIPNCRTLLICCAVSEPFAELYGTSAELYDPFGDRVAPSSARRSLSVLFRRDAAKVTMKCDNLKCTHMITILSRDLFLPSVVRRVRARDVRDV